MYGMTDKTISSMRKRVLENMALVFGVVGGIWAMIAFIEWRVEKHLKDPAIVTQIASRVRPSIIFDSEGIILADQGGLDYVEAETLTVTVANPGPLYTIALRSKRFLDNPPLLECLDPVLLDIDVKRGTGLAWDIRCTMLSGMTRRRNETTFRLEIIP